MSASPKDLLPDRAPSLFDSSGVLLLCVVGLIAVALVGYFVYDYVQAYRRSRRLEALRGRRMD
jgi:hypothetical protein